MRLAASHHTDVARVRRESPLNGGHVELRVVSENAHGVARAKGCPMFGEQLIGPRHHHLVCHRKPPRGGKHLACITHRDSIAEHLGNAGERTGEIDRAKNHHLRGPGERLDEHPHHR